MAPKRRRLRLSPSISQGSSPDHSPNPYTGGSSQGLNLRPLPRNYETDIPVPNNFHAKKLVLANRKIRPTLFYDHFTCEELGIDEVVRRLARNLGFDGFLNNRLTNEWVTTDESYYSPEQPPLTYKSLTIEFLSTFERKRVADEVTGKPSQFITFRMFGKNQRVTLRQLNQMFGWDPEAELTDLSGKNEEEFNSTAWWVRITNGEFPFSPTSSKASEIHHPALRYLHRMLVFCFFSRGEMGRVITSDNYLLWRAADGAAFVNQEENKDKKINWGYILADRFDKVRNVDRFSGPILFGGMITWIAYQLNFKDELRQLSPLQYTSTLSIAPLQNMTFIAEADESSESCHICLVRERPWCYLPYEYITNPPTGPAANPWRLPIGHIAPTDLTPDDVTWRAEQMVILQQHQEMQQHQQQQPQQQQQQQQHYHRRRRTDESGPSSRPSTSEGGNISPSFNMRSIEDSFANLSLQMTQLNNNVSSLMHSAPPPIYEWHLYDHFVDQGMISPPVNYPYHPPQYGPVPNWAPREFDSEGREIPRVGGTYPYWEGPGSLHRPPTPRPPYDYTAMGGCDYRGDPAYPYVSYDPSCPFPPGFTGWGDRGPPPHYEDSDSS